VAQENRDGWVRLVASDFRPDRLKQLLQRVLTKHFAQPSPAWRQTSGRHDHTALQVTKDGHGIAGRRGAANLHALPVPRGAVDLLAIEVGRRQGQSRREPIRGGLDRIEGVRQSSDRTMAVE
jgi:hypothetical protein